MDAVDEAIVDTINQITHPKTGAFRRCYPHDVVSFLPVRLSARTVRLRMTRLARTGVIYRHGTARGYVSRYRAEHDAHEALRAAMRSVTSVIDRHAGLIDRETLLQMLDAA